MVEQKRRFFVFSETTRFTFPILIAALGLCTWLTTMYVQGSTNTETITSIKVKQDKMESLYIDVEIIKHDIKDINKKLDKFLEP